MIKDYKGIESVITEVYKIKKEKRGVFFSKTIETEKLISKKKEYYKNGILSSFEEIYQSYNGDMMRTIGEYTILPNGESKNIIKRYNETSKKLVEEEIFLKDKFGNTYSYVSHDYESNFIPISLWKYELVYNSRNKLVQKKSYYKDELKQIQTFEYDYEGRCVKKTTQYYEKEQNYKEETIYNSYDQESLHIREDIIVKYKLQLKYLEGKDGKTTKLWERNEHGDVVHTEYSCDGNLSHYTHELKYDYKNNCIEDRYYVTGANASQDGRLYKYKIAYKDEMKLL